MESLGPETATWGSSLQQTTSVSPVPGSVPPRHGSQEQEDAPQTGPLPPISASGGHDQVGDVIEGDVRVTGDVTEAGEEGEGVTEGLSSASRAPPIPEKVFGNPFL